MTHPVLLAFAVGQGLSKPKSPGNKTFIARCAAYQVLETPGGSELTPLIRLLYKALVLVW